jgi:hypothetical protein
MACADGCLRAGTVGVVRGTGSDRSPFGDAPLSRERMDTWKTASGSAWGSAIVHIPTFSARPARGFHEMARSVEGR